MSNIMDKLCDGCLMHEKYKVNPFSNTKCDGYIVKDIGCPCINCLIKMICTTTCKEIEERKWSVTHDVKKEL